MVKPIPGKFLYNTSQATDMCESRPDLIIYVFTLQPIPEEDLCNTSHATDMCKSRPCLVIYVFMLQPIPEEGLYNTSQATDMCESMLAAADVSSMCVQGVGIDVTVDVQGCVEDIMVCISQRLYLCLLWTLNLIKEGCIFFK